MELKQSYQQVMNGSATMALATSVDNQPNVRVVTFAYDEQEEGRLFFTTFKGSGKMAEFENNSKVACLPLPSAPGAQVRIFGQVKRSEMPLSRIIDMVAKKAPGDAETLRQGGAMLEIYEVGFSEAWVTVGMTSAQKLTL